MIKVYRFMERIKVKGEETVGRQEVIEER